MSGTLPTVDPFTGQWVRPERAAAQPLPEAYNLPRMAPAERPGVFTAGLNVGYQNMVGTGGSALEALGRATGISGLEQYGRGVADYRAGRVQQVGRSDLDTAPWREGGASVLPWLGYNLAQQIPNFATTAAAFLAGGPGGAAAAGARGFGLRAGLNAVASRVGVSPGALLAGASMLPQGAGSMYREAVESARAETGDQNARPSAGAAAAALGLSPLYAAAEAIPTARVLNIARGTGVGAAGAGRLMRAARGAAEGAATEFVTEGVQSGMEQGFRPDLSLGQRAANVLDGAITGMAVGGVMGGGAGLVSRNATRAVAGQDAATTPTTDLAAAIDQVLTPTPMSRGAAATAAQPDLFGAPIEQTPAEGGLREAAPLPPEEGLPLPGIGDNPLLAEPGMSAMPLERSRNPDAGAPGREIALDTPNIIRQALQSAGDNVRDNQDFRRFIRQFEATDEIGLAREVAERLNDRRPTKRLLALAEGLGFFDREGQPRNFEAEMAAARGEAQAALAAQDAAAAQTAARKIESIQRAARIQEALAAQPAEAATPLVVAPQTPPLTEMPLAAAQQARTEAAAQPVEPGMSALPLEWARPAPEVEAPVAVPPAAAPPIDPARLTTTPGPAPNEALAAWAKQPRIAAALVEGDPLVTRMAEVATIAGTKKQDATLARKWLERFEERGAIPPDQQASAERLLARVYQTGGADAVQVGRAEGVDVRQPAQDGPQVGEGNPEGQGAPAARAEEAAAPQQQGVAQQGTLALPQPVARAQTAPPRAPRSSTPAEGGGSSSPTSARRVSPPAAPVSAAPETTDKDAARVDAAGDPVADPTQAIKLTPEQRTILTRAAQSPLLDVEARRGALEALNAPTRGKVDTAVEGFRQAVMERAEAQKRTQPSQAVRLLRQAAKDRRVPQAVRDRLDAAAEALHSSDRGTQAYDRAVARAGEANAAYRTALARGPQTQTPAARGAPAKQTKGDRIEAIRDAAARAGILKPKFMRARRADRLLPPRASDARPPLTDQAFNAALERALSRLPPAYRDVVQPVTRVEDLPQGLQDQVAAEGMTAADFTGVLYDGKVYVMRPSMRSVADVQEAVFHEVFGHIGSRALFGRDSVSALADIFERAGGREGVLRLADKLGARRDLAQYLTGESTDRANAALVDELLAQAAGRSQGSVSMLAREWMGRFKQATIRFLRANGMDALASRFSSYSALDMAVTLRDMRQAVAEGQADADTSPVFSRVAPAIAQAERAAASVAKQATAMFEKMQAQIGSGKNVSTWMRAQGLYLTTLNHIARTYGRLFPVTETFQHSVDGAQNLLENISNINRRRATISAKFAELFAPTWNAYERMPEGANENLRWLMEIAAYEVDPRKTWEQHKWLHDDKANVDKMKGLVAEANKRYAEMRIERNGQRASDVFDNMALYNRMQRYASMTTLMHNVMRSDPQYRDAAPEGFADDPMADFLTASGQVQNSLQAAHDFWKAAFDRKIAAADALWRNQWEAERNAGSASADAKTTLPKDKTPYNDPKASPRVNLLAKTLRDMRANVEGLTKHPYFHLGRVGEYFASFNITQPTERAKGARAGAPDPASAERVSQALIAAGFDDFSIPVDAERANVFLRVDSPEQLANLEKVLRDLEAGGAIEDGTIKRGHRDEASGIAAADAKFLEEAVSRFATSPAFAPPEGTEKGSPEWVAAEKVRDRAVSQLREAWLNMLPGTSEARVMTQRKVVSGWSKDMMNSYAFRANVGNLALANLSTSAPMQATLNGMRSALRDAEGSKTSSLADTLARQQVLQEVLTRETNRPMHTGRDWVDAFRAINYAHFLGMSPAYALNNMTQVYVTLWPELSKRHGFVASAKEIARSTGVAIRVMKAALKAGWATTSPDEGLGTRARRATEPDITLKVLQDAGVPAEMQAYVMRLVNTGVVDIGGAARELGRLAERNTMGALDNILRYAGAFGLYSEAAIRLASGMSLYNLEKAKQGANFDSTKIVPDAVRLIDETMFNYTEANVGRALGRSGVAGRFTPIATAFQQFNAQMLEKLVREFADVVGAQREGETDAERSTRRKEAVTFLGMHMAAVTVLAGSLGLPGVTAIAAAVNSLKDLLDDDDEPYDLQASWRNFLAQVMGKDVGEVVARGLPRAIGVDTSTRLGEQDIIPFSRFFADRRKMEDAGPDQAMRMMGAPFSMLSGMAIGMREMANGNILAGMQSALPVAVRSPVSAFRLTQEGYVNREGVRLPVESPGAGAVLTQALGYRPAALAEYQEANLTQAQRRGIITRDAGRIRGQLLKALETNNQEAARDLLQEARAFDQNNPAYAILPRLGTALQSRVVARTRADALGVPLGVSMRDVAARERTAFANY